MNNGGLGSKRPSLSVPGTSAMGNDQTPTIGQLLAEANLNQPVVISSSYLTVDSNGVPVNNQQHRARS